MPAQRRRRQCRCKAARRALPTYALFVAPLLHALLSIGIVIILVVFILLDRDHITDQFVRLFGASNVHATSEALRDAQRGPLAIARGWASLRSLCRRGP